MNIHTQLSLWRSEGTAPLIFNTICIWECNVSFTPQPINSRRKIPLYLLNIKLCGPSRRPGQNLLSPPGIELLILGCRARSLVTTPTELSDCRHRLLFVILKVNTQGVIPKAISDVSEAAQ
jgi:hypothetical protein